MQWEIQDGCSLLSILSLASSNHPYPATGHHLWPD
jgi:hypothetical protein